MFSTSRVLAVAIALPLASGSILSLADGLSSVPGANTKTAGSAAPNVLSPELAEKVVARGSNPLENPSADFAFYGYSTDGPMLPAFGTNVEATKTEPDKNTYLVLPKLSGSDPNYNYGRHFLFQGHENGKRTAAAPPTAISPASTSTPTTHTGSRCSPIMTVMARPCRLSTAPHGIPGRSACYSAPRARTAAEYGRLRLISL